MWKEVIAADVILDKENKEKLQKLRKEISTLIVIYNIDKYYVNYKNYEFLISKFRSHSFRLFVTDKINYEIVESLWNTVKHIVRNYFRRIQDVEYLSFVSEIDWKMDISIRFKNSNYYNTIMLGNIKEKHHDTYFICDKNERIIKLCNNLLDKHSQIEFIIQSNSNLYFYWKNIGWRYAHLYDLFNHKNTIYYALLYNVNSNLKEALINYATISKL
jgi:hypothetical protein